MRRTASLLLAGVAVASVLVAARPARQPANELVLTEELIVDFVRVAWFADGGRFHFSTYSDCNYSFLQNPSVRISDGELVIEAEYWRRTATSVGNRCVGGPGADFPVVMRSRPFSRGGAVVLEITDVQTSGSATINSTLLSLAGVSLPMEYEIDMMSMLNRSLHDSGYGFGVAELDLHEIVADGGVIRLPWTMRLGNW